MAHFQGNSLAITTAGSKSSGLKSRIANAVHHTAALIFTTTTTTTTNEDAPPPNRSVSFAPTTPDTHSSAAFLTKRAAWERATREQFHTSKQILALTPRKKVRFSPVMEVIPVPRTWKKPLFALDAEVIPEKRIERFTILETIEEEENEE